MDKRHIIEPENLPLWTAVTFIIALLALVIGLTNLYRTSTSTVITQVQILKLHQELDALTAKNKP
jgi:hypothetical protein